MAPLMAGLTGSVLASAVRFERGGGAFAIATSQSTTPVWVDPSDHKGVARVAHDFAADVARVTGAAPPTVSTRGTGVRRAIIVGSLDRSPLVQDLVRRGKLDVSGVAGQWEACVVQTVAQPFPGVDEALVIAGADKRGTIYGVYDLSRSIGVSPWYWWADVPVRRRAGIWLDAGRRVQRSPAVKYRGIFLNNEAPCLSGWTAEKFGGMNSAFYAKVFELLLRLKANYLWPAMWNNAFADDDPRNAELADEYGIVMGTSHHEPMNRAHKEFTSRREHIGNGEWNYVSNGDAVREFFREGAARSKQHELLVTLGMRGDGDVALEGTGGLQSDIRLLEQVIADQRQLLVEQTGKRIKDIPQVWVLFTEVQKYYDAGLKLPADVTLMFSDDNVGYLRRLPTAAERTSRTGGFGIYHHMDMNGGPFSYKWTNTNPLPKLWEQLNQALHHGADRIWISNVGDLKPLELPIEFFLAMAWDPAAMGRDKLQAWTEAWAARDFGAEHARDIARLASRYAKANAWRKPEVLKPDTYSLEHHDEALRLSRFWGELRRDAEGVNTRLQPDQRAAYYQFVLHPVRACANLNELLLAAARNQRFSRQARASANDEAALVRRLFAESRRIRDTYNLELVGGKWNHLMDQTYLGYFDWYQPTADIPPAVTELDLPDDARFGVAVDGSVQGWPGYYLPPTLPTFDGLLRNTSWLEVFPRGKRPAPVQVTAEQSWIRLRAVPAFSAGKDDVRHEVSIDWANVPEGNASGSIVVTDGRERVTVGVRVAGATVSQRDAARGAWGSLGAPFSIPADGFTRNVEARGVRWLPLPDYGRVEVAMTPEPVTAASFADPRQAPRLHYPLFVGGAGEFNVDVITAPTLRIDPAHELSLALWVDDGAPIVRSVFNPQERESQEFLGRQHDLNARADMRVMRFKLRIDTPGRHVLTVAMVDPGLVLQQLIVYRDRLPASYFGPLPQRLEA
ncbi:glycosyl hydrolase 115 family protein [Roseateles cellulosilyticus]|nr:glycosyl hydrolase 115 family protein [Pelomonas sp. P8]